MINMKSKAELPKWVSITGTIVLFGSFAIVIYYYWIYKDRELEKRGRYTIGVTVDTYRTLKSGRWIKYNFNVNNKTFEDSEREDNRISVVVPNGRYYVLYVSDKPELNEVLFDKPVPDSIKAAPLEGWDKIPGEK